MTRAEKRKFVRGLCASIARDICANVARMPDEWDGMELRELIADFADASRAIRLPAHAKRLREYRKLRFILNLL